jgi:hypothetical protein
MMNKKKKKKNTWMTTMILTMKTSRLSINGHYDQGGAPLGSPA